MLGIENTYVVKTTEQRDSRHLLSILLSSRIVQVNTNIAVAVKTAPDLQQDRAAFTTYSDALEELLLFVELTSLLGLPRRSNSAPSDSIIDAFADFLYSTGALVHDKQERTRLWPLWILHGQ